MSICIKAASLLILKKLVLRIYGYFRVMINKPRGKWYKYRYLMLSNWA